MAQVYAAQDGNFDSLCLAAGQVAAPKAPKAPKDVVHHHPPKEMAADVGFPVRGGQTLLIAYFPWEASEADIEREFCRFCRVKRVHLVVHKSSQKPRCFGFVKFMTKADAEEALHATSQGLVQLLDARGHIWHLKAEWTKSGDMVVDDSETEQEVAKRKEERRFRTDRNAAGDSPAEDCVHAVVRGRGSRWPGSSVKGQMPMMQHPMPPLHQQHQHQLGYQQLSQGHPPAQQHQQQNYSPQGYGSGQPYLSSQQAGMLSDDVFQAHHHYGSSSGSYAGNPQEPYPPSLSSYGGGPQGPHSPPWEGYGPPAGYSPQGPQPQGHQQQSYSHLGYGNGGQQPFGSGQQGYTSSSSQSYQPQQQGYGGQAYSSPQQQLPPSQQHHHHQQGLMGYGGYAQGPPPPSPMQTHLDMSAGLHDCGRQANYSSPPQPSQNETGSMPGVVPNMVNDPALLGSSTSAVGGSSVPGQQHQQQQHHQHQQQHQQHQHQQHQHSQHNQQQHLHPQHQLHQHQQPQLQPQHQQQQSQHPSLQQQQHQPQHVQAAEGSSVQHLPSPPAQQPPAPPAGRVSLASGSGPAAIWNSFDDAAAKGMVDGLVGGEDGGVSQHMPMWTPNVA